MTAAAQLAQMGSNNSTFRNRIINGDMRIDQRNAGNPVTINAANPLYCTDRFNVHVGGSSAVYSAQQVLDAPAGFVNSLKLTVTTAATLSAAQFSFTRQIIEGYNIADLAWGTASASAVAISFWVKSSLTGTFAVACINSAEDRSYPATFTINSANTWEYKTVTVAGDTTGTWLTNNSNGIRLAFDLGSGSNYNGTANAWQSGWKQRTSGCVSFSQTVGATFQITGVQLEKGTVATPFEFRSYGVEENLCKRYYQKYVGGSTYGYVGFTFGVGGGTSFNCTMAFEQEMRVAPSLASTLTGFGCWDGGFLRAITAVSTLYTTTKGIRADMVVGGGGLTTGASYSCYGSSSTVFQLSAEL